MSSLTLEEFLERWAGLGRSCWCSGLRMAGGLSSWAFAVVVIVALEA